MTDVVSHPAKFSDALLPRIRHMLTCVAQLPAGAQILDPFAGTGKGVEYLRYVCGFDAHGIELEPEWADTSHWVEQGNALTLPYDANKFDAIVTSPAYGNRMADKDMRDSVAGTYAKSLGRLASAWSSCHMQWNNGPSGDAYRDFHTEAWREALRVLKPGGWFLLNIKDHVRAKEIQPVSRWHVDTLIEIGLERIESEYVGTPSQRRGENHDARVDGEWLHLLRKPE